MANEKTKTIVPATDGLRPGDIVYWHNNGEIANGRLPAMIIYVRTGNALCIKIFGEGNDVVYDGVKSVQDESRTKLHTERVGAWSLREAK